MCLGWGIRAAAFTARGLWVCARVQRRISAGAQCFVLCRRLVTQGLQGLPLYLGRIIFSVIVSLVYGGTYWKLNRSFLGAQERAVVLFIVAAVLPALAIGTLPFYTNGTNVRFPSKASLPRQLLPQNMSNVLLSSQEQV